MWKVYILGTWSCIAEVASLAEIYFSCKLKNQWQSAGQFKDISSIIIRFLSRARIQNSLATWVNFIQDALATSIHV